MRWWRRRKQEEDLDRELRAILSLRPKNDAIGAYRRLKPGTLRNAPSVTLHW